ncbi:hypothetical protein BH10PLA2_BH10PLA2_17700 [soil metagenome]
MFGISGCRLSLGLAALLLVQVHPVAAQSNKKDDPPAKADKSEDKDAKKGPKLVRAGVLRGRLVKLEEDSFKLEVDLGKQKQTLEILINDDVKVRVPPTIEFDDKGKPKRPKKDPSDKDSKLGGKKGAREDLASNQDIEVSISRLPNRKLIATVVKVLKKPDQ